MRKYLFLLVLAAISAYAQNPATRNPVRGVGAPSNTTCNIPGQYGNLYFDTASASDFYTCGTAGWAKQSAAAGTVTSVSGTSPISVATGTTIPVVSLNDTAVTPAAYTNANITVDQKGRITAAASGSSGASPAGPNGCPQLSATSVLACQTNTVVLLPSGGDDTAAISAAIASGYNIHLTVGTFNVGIGCSGTVFTLSTPLNIIGEGMGRTFLKNQCAARNLFDITYNWSSSASTSIVADQISDFTVTQDPLVPATAGFLFNVASGGGANTYVTGLLIRRIGSNNVWGQIYSGTGVISNWFEDLFCYANASAYCWVVNSPSPSGDTFWSNINSNNNGGSNGGFLDCVSDTMTILNPKINGANFDVKGGVFGCGANPTVIGLRVMNSSVESGSLNLTAASGSIADVSVTGGQFAVNNPSITPSGVKGLALTGGIKFYGTNPISLTNGTTATVSDNIFDANGIMVNIASGSQAVVQGNVIQQVHSGSGTSFVTTDSSITSGLIVQNNIGNPSVLTNNFNAASLVASNIVPAVIAVAGANDTCSAGRPVFQGTTGGSPYLFACTAANTLQRAALSSFAVAGFSLIQHPTKVNCTSSATCTITASSTTAGNLLILVAQSFTVASSGAYSSASGDGSWTHCPASNSTVTGGGATVYGDCAYILSATGGATSISWTWGNGTQSVPWSLELLEFHPQGAVVTYDTGNTISSAGCSSCTGAALTLAASTYHLIIQWSGSTTSTVTAITGAGYISPNDIATTGVVGWVNATSGSAQTWTQGASTGFESGAVAFQGN